MKNKRIKMLISAVLAVIMVLSMVPVFAFAQGAMKPVTDIAVETKKPMPGAAYSDPDGKADKAYKIDVARKCGLKVVEEGWFSINKDGTEPFIPNFWGNSTYLMSVKLKVKNGYALPEDLSKLKVSVKFDKDEPLVLDARQYRAPDEFKMESDTYTIAYVEQPRAKDKTADIELLYAMKLKPLEMPEMVVTTKMPVLDDYYLLPEGQNQEYSIYLEEGAGFLVDKSGWLAMEKDGTIHFDNRFKGGRKYVMAVGLTFMPRYGIYELPEDLKDVKIKLDFTNVDDVVLTEKDYRAGDDFKFETGTYTLRPAKDKDADYKYELMYVVELPEAEKPAEKPDEKPTDVPAVKPDETAPVAPAETTVKAEPEKEEAPNTGSTLSVATLGALSVAAIGAYISKKKKR